MLTAATMCVVAVLLLQPLLGSGASAQPIAVRSEFVSELSVPGSMDHFIRPGRVVYDRTAEEIYVADQGNNRIVIFNSEGAYRFEFNLAGRIGSIVDFAVSPSGFIYILGSTLQGRKLLTFDFDGLFIGEFGTDPTMFSGMELSSVATDSENRLYVLDAKALQVLIFAPSGDLMKSIPVLTGIDDDTRAEVVLGTLSTTEDGFLVPISSFGMVYRYLRDGKHIRTYGYKGTTTGELSFPVSAAVTGNGLITVLDKQRFTILCYSAEGKCLGEFGGKGRRPGWFYFPSYLSADSEDRVMISQVFMNRIQICRVPEAIIDRLEATRPADGEASDEASGKATVARGDNTSQTEDKTEVTDLVGHSQHFSTKGGL